ncbi:MAG: 3-deoxy-D-manno-octulosonic acid kinase [Gammaproteobacteria bacterium]
MIVYDASLLSHISESIFEPSSWPDAEAVEGVAAGRGTTLFITHEDRSWALRHYHRGGLVGKFVNDSFLWMGSGRTRPVIEWDLLAQIQDLGLPAPKPVAARYLRSGFTYTADIITERIPKVTPLSRLLLEQSIDDSCWENVGACIAKFHSARICHADLNAHNIQIGSENTVWLLDFDRGQIMSSNGSWKKRNLDRLHRSLAKVSQNNSELFGDQAWKILNAAYAQELR